MGLVASANQDGKLLTQQGAGAQGLHVRGQILWGGLLELEEIGREETQKVNSARRRVAGEAGLDAVSAVRRGL